MLIDYSISMKALSAYVEYYNTHQKKTKAQIRGSMVHTAKEIIRIYGVSLLKSNRIQPVTEDNIPSLRTNNIQLSKLTNMSGRTIKRHIKRLQKAGFITDKIGHGSNSSYELWISPKILWINGLKNSNNIIILKNKIKLLSTDFQEFENNLLSKCPDTDTRKPTRNKKNILIAVNKLTNLWDSSRDVKATTKISEDTTKQRSLLGQTNFIKAGKPSGYIAGYTQLKKPLKESTQLKEPWREQVESNKRIVGDRQKNQLKGSDSKIANEHKISSRQSFIEPYVDKLWKLALEKLYQHISLTKNQHIVARQLLQKWYDTVSEEKIEFVHNVYVKRLKLVEKYIERDPNNRFVSLPYLYFDTANPHGFRGTKKWYEHDKKHKKQLVFQKIVREQVKKYKTNFRKDTGEGRPILTVYRECKQRIEKLGIPSLLQQFHTEILGKNLLIKQLKYE